MTNHRQKMICLLTKDFSKLNLISETTAVEQKNNESYEVLQFLQENEYVYAVHEK